MGAADGIDVRVGATVLDKEARDATTLRQRLGVDKAGLDRLLRACPRHFHATCAGTVHH